MYQGIVHYRWPSGEEVSTKIVEHEDQSMWYAMMLGAVKGASGNGYVVTNVETWEV